MVQMRFGSTRQGEATCRKTIFGFLVLCEVVGVALVAVMLREPGMRGYGGAMLSGDLCLTRAILWPRLTNILGA